MSDTEESPPATATEAAEAAAADPGVEANTEPSLNPDDAQVAAPVKKTKKIKRVKKRRPARVQIDPSALERPRTEQPGQVYNIWYNKWAGGDREDDVQYHALGRCNPDTDSGYTKADSVNNSFFCKYFAKGICTQGRECEYLHRLPGLHDIFNPNVDCFGRSKWADYRDDMGGAGSFMRVNRTLYVGRIHVTDDVEEVVARHFAPWGQIERIRVLNMRGVAFVTYSNLANAEFAHEAMAHQSLDHDEVLNVRWAMIDPNPAAQKRDAKKIEEQAAEAIRKALPPAYVAQLEGRDPDARKRRKVDGNFGLEGYEAPDDVWYAMEKAEWVAQQQQPGQDATLDAPPHAAGTAADDMVQQSATLAIEASPPEPESSIFSRATLAALQARKTAPRAPVAMAKTSKSSAPLVAYPSDDDSD